MSDIDTALSAASFLLTVLALVYSAWSASIEKAIESKFATAEATAMKQKAEISKLNSRRALPLCVGSWLIAAAFAPRVFGIIQSTVQCFQTSKCAYNEVYSVFILTQLFLVVLAVHLTTQVCALKNKAN